MKAVRELLENRKEFMVEEILSGLYRIEVPLPKNPLKVLNSYVIKADGRSLIIDTGMNREECRSVILSGLEELKVDLNRTDFFITHMHADHSGLVSTLATGTSKVYAGQPDADIINHAAENSSWEKQTDYARRNGFPEDELQKAIENHPGRKYGVGRRIDFQIMKDGDPMSIGDYSFRCIKTPGHTRGHLCLYEPAKRLFISGDHILFDITPNISSWTDETNPLDDYLASLDRVYDLDVALTLPGHRSISKNFKGRIEELKHHHQVRADEVLSILKTGKQNAYEVASQMTWDMSYKYWSQFPPSQKWFATGEAVAHLKYLEEEGRVQREIQGRNIVFQ